MRASLYDWIEQNEPKKTKSRWQNDCLSEEKFIELICLIKVDMN
jgi:hypothetical protein